MPNLRDDLDLTASERAVLDALATGKHMTARGLVKAMVRELIYSVSGSAAEQRIMGAVRGGDTATDLTADRVAVAAASAQKAKGYLANDDPDRLPLPEPVNPPDPSPER